MGNIMLAIKLGSSTTSIYKFGEGFLLKEPSLVAVNTTNNSKEILAVGIEAKRLQARPNGEGHATVCSPIVEGIISDSVLASGMLKHFISKVCPKKFISPNIRALVCVPLGISLTERLAFEKVCYNAGIIDVTLVPSIVCSAVGAGVDIADDNSHLIVGIGGGCTDVAVVGQNMLMNGLNVGMGGANIDKAIEREVLKKHGLVISDITAEKIKKEIASLYVNDENCVTVSGKDNITKESKTVEVSAMDIYPAIEYFYSKICETITSLMAVCTPEVVGEFSSNKVLIVGGDSKVAGLGKYIKAKLNLSVKCYDDADDLDLVGAGKLLERKDLLKRLLINI